ncbi:MAG: ABC transporter ATP-binding protein [Deltaproteobacteria bacterium]|nr:ABC transporter ATP-binding protein [Deltaproteobacteria bacterium]MBW2570800.1 ABC transporter ATP-binding protein [Deltaproteobacteria bacterium]MBW2668407.1 ABC transporter ATP-binding protein [Deltaproteobacteria bacterium]
MGDEKKLLPDRFLTVRDLCKSFDNSETRIDILKGVNLDMDAGQTLAIVGASGIGKSTLLHILGALDRPDSGVYFFNGDDIFVFDQIRLAQFRNDTVGFVFQFHYLLPEFSALENTMMPVLIKGMGKKEAREIAEAMLVRVNLKDRLNFRVGKLSGGEQQRVALARALVLKPAMLLADEPTGNLDKRNSELIHDLLLELNDEFGMTLIVVTHNMELASYMSHTTTIADGQLVEL